jgi:antitoxin component YwqK of YwqJK toxin-antitoxin module
MVMEIAYFKEGKNHGQFLSLNRNGEWTIGHYEQGKAHGRFVNHYVSSNRPVIEFYYNMGH